MTRHWLFITFYIVFIGIVTYFVAGFTEAEKVQDFLLYNKEIIDQDELSLLSATIFANYNDGREAYILKEPLYQETFETQEHQVKVFIFTFLEIKNNEATNNIAIILRDVYLDIEDLVLNEYQETVVLVDITFNQAVTFGSRTEKVFTEVMAAGYTDQTKILTIPYDLLDASSTIEIEKITFHYALPNKTTPQFLVLSNSDFGEVITDDLFDGGFDRDIKNVNATQIQLTEKYNVNDIADESDIYYDHTLVDRLNAYNWYYMKNIGIEMLFILPMTYLIFFHRFVIDKIKLKRAAKQEEKRAQIEKYKKEMFHKDKENAQ